MNAMQVFQTPRVMMDIYSICVLSKRSNGFTHIFQITPMDGYKAIKPSTKVYVVILIGPYT